MKLVYVNLGAELDDVSESDVLFCVPHEKGLGDEAGILVEDLRFKQSMETSMLVVVIYVTARLKMIRVRIVDLFIILIEDLKFEEVDSLLE